MPINQKQLINKEDIIEPIISIKPFLILALYNWLLQKVLKFGMTLTSGAIGKYCKQSELSFSSSELQNAATGSMEDTSTCQYMISMQK